MEGKNFSPTHQKAPGLPGDEWSCRPKGLRCGVSQRVLALCAKIPKGRVTTYGIMALRLGRPGGARAVGRALGKNPKPGKIPCHRVVCSCGRVGGYKLGTHKKMKLLRSEGVEVKNGKVVGFGECLYKFGGARNEK